MNIKQRNQLLDRSTLNDSNVVLLANKFWNGATFSVDAKRIVSWYNLFPVWDNYTFSHMQQTPFHGRFLYYFIPMNSMHIMFCKK